MGDTNHTNFQFVAYCVLTWLNFKETDSNTVNKCPENRERMRVRETFCNDPSRYHCLPDSQCNLHKFCARPETNLTASVFLVGNGNLIEKIIHIPDSNTALYELISNYVCKFSVEGIALYEYFKKMMEKTKTFIKMDNAYIGDCPSPTKHHFLPSEGCFTAAHCILLEKVPQFSLVIYDEKASKSEKLKTWQFEMNFSNSPSYYQIAFILCSLNQLEFYDEKYYEYLNITFSDNKTTPKRNNIENSRLRNFQEYSNNFEYRGIIAGIAFPCLLLFLLGISYLYQKMKQNEDNEIQNTNIDNETTIDVDTDANTCSIQSFKSHSCTDNSITNPQ